MFKKLFSILVAAVLAICLSACSENSGKIPDAENVSEESVKENTENSSTKTDNEEVDYLSDLSKEKYDGYSFRILTRKGKLSDQYLDEESADIVESATYKRNKLVEEMYGVTIVGSESSNSDYETDALNSILAGDDAYDLIFAHSRAAFAYAVNGAAYNINEIQSIHTEKPWWNKDIVESCNIGEKLYVLDGDISSWGLGATMCLFFNKNLFDELGFDYPYEAVLDGEWTFDEFAYIAKKGGKDLNGDGVMTPDADRYGFRAEEWFSPLAILYTGGQKIYDKNENGFAYLSLYSNKTVDIFDEFFSLMDNEACHLLSKKNTFDGYDMFKEGRALITDAILRQAKDFRNMTDDFGIVPFPKFDEEDSYNSITNGGSHLIIIPITVSDVERTGAITEALCAIGSRDVIPVFYEKSLKTKYSRDEESEEMIDIIKDGRIYDIGYVAGGTFQSCGYDLANSASSDFTSYYKSKENAAQSGVEKFNADYGGFEK